MQTREDILVGGYEGQVQTLNLVRVTTRNCKPIETTVMVGILPLIFLPNHASFSQYFPSARSILYNLFMLNVQGKPRSNSIK